MRRLSVTKVYSSLWQLPARVCPVQEQVSCCFCSSRKDEAFTQAGAIPETHFSALTSLDHRGECQTLRIIILSFLVLTWSSGRFQSQISQRGGLHSLPPHLLLQSLLTHGHLASAPYHCAKIDLAKVTDDSVCQNKVRFSAVSYITSLPAIAGLTFPFLSCWDITLCWFFCLLGCSVLDSLEGTFSGSLIWEFLRVLSSTLLSFSLNLVSNKLHSHCVILNLYP